LNLACKETFVMNRRAIIHNRIAHAAPSVASPSPAHAAAGFVAAPIAAFPLLSADAPEFYRLMYDRAVARVETLRRLRREYRAAMSIWLN